VRIVPVTAIRTMDPTRRSTPRGANLGSICGLEEEVNVQDGPETTSRPSEGEEAAANRTLR